MRVLSPLAGSAVSLEQVPDPVFAGRMVGPGVAIEPAPEVTSALAPIAGTLVKVHPHAFVIVGDEGIGVLVHLGIDTVKLDGAGFEVLRSQGEELAAGEEIVRWDPAAVRAAGLSAIVPVIALDQAKDAVADPGAGQVDAGEELFVL